MESKSEQLWAILLYVLICNENSVLFYLFINDPFFLFSPYSFYI